MNTPEHSDSLPPAEIPALPPDATPEQKDHHWHTYVYQGDRMPQLTVRAVLMGGILGMAMAAANLYTTLAIGWAFGIAITACVLSYVIWTLIRAVSGNSVSQMSVLENACMASTASAAGYSTGSTIATMFGALVLLKEVPEGVSTASIKTWDVSEPWVVVVFTLCTGLMGVLLAIPMKRQQINHEQLPFPSGTAAAETLRSLYSQSKEAMRKAYILVVGLFAGLLIGFMRAPQDVLDQVPFLRRFFSWLGFRIPSEIEITSINRAYPGNRFASGFSFEPSALLIAAGMIVGPRISTSMLIGSLALYMWAGPMLSKVDADHFGRGGPAIVEAVQTATGISIEHGVDQKIDITKPPEQVAQAATAAVAEAVDKLNLHSTEPTIKAANRGAAGAMADIDAKRAKKSVEAIVAKAGELGMKTSAIESAVAHAARDADAGVNVLQVTVALDEAKRQANAKGVDAKPLIVAVQEAGRKAESDADAVAGEAILNAVLQAATKEGADVERIRKAASEASDRARSNKGREGARVALELAVKIVYDEMKNDPAPLRETVQAISAPANKQAGDRVLKAQLTEVEKQAGILGLDAEAIMGAASRAVELSEGSRTGLLTGIAMAVVEDEAKGTSTDVSIIAKAGAAVEFTEKEKEENLKSIVAAVIGGKTGAAALASDQIANHDAIVAREEAIKDALGENKKFKDVVDAGELAYESKRYKENFIWSWGDHSITIFRWSLWGGTSLMVFSSLMSVALQWKTIVRAFSKFRDKGAASDAATGVASVEVPGSWMVIGMLPITIAMVWLQIQAFDVAWWAGVIAVAMSFVLSLVASRATGETDTTPIGAMGKVMQLMFAVLAPKNTVANLASAGIAANSASASADLLTDLKTGYLLGANPRKQFIAQFLGVFFGTIAIVPIWYLMVPTRAKLETFAMPATQAWAAVAKVLVKGVGELPQSAVISIFVGAVLGCVLPVIEKFLPPKAKKFMPSATGLGLSWVIPFTNAFSFFIGAIIAEIWRLLHPKTQEHYNVPVASGLVAGESMMLALLAIIATATGLLMAN